MLPSSSFSKPLRKRPSRTPTSREITQSSRWRSVRWLTTSSSLFCACRRVTMSCRVLYTKRLFLSRPLNILSQLHQKQKSTFSVYLCSARSSTL
ncbi:Piso0_000832 [Millerozyma farinosa CBS 7064]|uniref:Piso0_000832 protein n=1 Tax=Pichia sorbitophila (strain ATCC MYA-4447 / BCRC 22081 / CBS 7064 / NBRC 10061 / NRRL Y-12695) TaxID=559304 RepID=G8YRM8_PICSO|nr:Piso0_000832 [Millerozyma farinosa CBS 7064]